MFKNNTAFLREIVTEYLKYAEKPTIREIANVIRPYCVFTEEELLEKELIRKSRYIMRSFKDGNNVRSYFSDDDGFYINVDISTDLVDLSKVDKQLNRKYAGLATAMEKVRNRIANIALQFKIVRM